MLDKQPEKERNRADEGSELKTKKNQTFDIICKCFRRLLFEYNVCDNPRKKKYTQFTFLITRIFIAFFIS